MHKSVSLFLDLFLFCALAVSFFGEGDKDEDGEIGTLAFHVYKVFIAKGRDG